MIFLKMTHERECELGGSKMTDLKPGKYVLCKDETPVAVRVATGTIRADGLISELEKISDSNWSYQQYDAEMEIDKSVLTDVEGVLI